MWKHSPKQHSSCQEVEDSRNVTKKPKKQIAPYSGGTSRFYMRRINGLRNWMLLEDNVQKNLTAGDSPGKKTSLLRLARTKIQTYHGIQSPNANHKNVLSLLGLLLEPALASYSY